MKETPYKNSILILGNYGNFNIGDELLLRYTLNKICKKNNMNKFIYIPTRNPEFITLYHPTYSQMVKTIPINNPMLLLKAFLKSTVIIVSGGGIWSGYTGTLAHFIPLITIIGKLFGKRIEYHGVGVYSSASYLDKLFVNIAFLLADLCSVRDDESYRILWYINRKKTIKVDDLAIQYLQNLPSRYIDSIELPMDFAKVFSKNTIYIGISVKPTKNIDVNYKIIHAFVDAINILNIKYPNKFYFVFLPFAKTPSIIENDEVLSEEIIKKLPKNNVSILVHTDPLVWFKIIKKYINIFICMRFHAVVLASMTKKPVLCIPYERKIIEFLNKYSIQNISIIPPEQLESTDIINFVETYYK